MATSANKREEPFNEFEELHTYYTANQHEKCVAKARELLDQRDLPIQLRLLTYIILGQTLPFSEEKIERYCRAKCLLRIMRQRCLRPGESALMDECMEIARRLLVELKMALLVPGWDDTV